MTLFKRGGVWWAYWWLDGVRSHASTETGNKRLAEKIARKLQDDAVARKHRLVVTDPDFTFGELAARFIADAGPTPYQLGRLKELLPFFADRTVISLTKGHAAEYRLWRKELKPVSDATVNRDLSVMRRILNWGVDNAMLLDNPFGRLRLVAERKMKTRVLSVREEPWLLAACAKHFHPIVMMALDTGMRRGELLNQRWEDVDLDRRLLLVSKSKTVGGEGREVPFTERVYDFLRVNYQREGYLFTYHKHTIHLVKTAWKRALDRSGIRRLRFHDLRHTCATRLMEAGIVADVRKSILGHSSGRDIHSRYTHVELPAKREAIRKLEEWLKTQLAQAQKGGDDHASPTVRPDLGSNSRAGGSELERNHLEMSGQLSAPPRSLPRCRSRRAGRTG